MSNQGHLAGKCRQEGYDDSSQDHFLAPFLSDGYLPSPKNPSLCLGQLKQDDMMIMHPQESVGIGCSLQTSNV